MSETSEIVTPTLEALNAIPGVYAYRVFTGQARVRGGMLHGAPNGTPDIAVVANGVPVFLEAKTDTGRCSPEQEKAQERLIRAGAYVAVVRSVRDAISVVREILDG